MISTDAAVEERILRCGVNFMLPIAQETSDDEANPFAAEQIKCDKTIWIHMTRCTY